MKVFRLSIFVVLSLVASSSFSHHSFSPFNMVDEATISGEVVDFEWTNPHTWVWVNVINEDGSITKWGLEGMSPNYLGRRGWTKRTFEPGDSVEFIIHPLHSGEPGGMLVKATLEDGTEKVMFGG